MLREITSLRLNHALEILELRGPILEVAREISELMRVGGIQGAVVGGIAVVLHRYVRTMQGVDVFCEESHETLGSCLAANGFAFNRDRQEFVRDDVRVHLVTLEQIVEPPREIVEIEGITTVSLPDIIGMKLRSGTNNCLRAKDLGDAIGLIRHHQLSGEFARNLDKTIRPAYRNTIKALKAESSDGST